MNGEAEMNPSTATRLRNPHHGLKEKLKTLTLLYEQQKQASAALKNASFRFPEKTVMRENSMPNTIVTRTFVLPQPPSNDDDAKENAVIGADRIVGFSCPRKTTTNNNVSNNNVSVTCSATVARKLSMQEPERVDAVSEKQGKVGSRIMVFVRLRPMNKKEKEAGSRCCVRVVNRRDVYLTEFANENDYLRLNRLRGRHFTFDAAFPDSASQQEVYTTS